MQRRKIEEVMSNCIIAMQSATMAKKAERALNAVRIPCNTVSIDPSVTKRGCGYGVSMGCSFLSEAVRVLERKNITHGEVIGGY
jgi:hypothetical protein